jgi:hypothetical protein
VTNKFFERDVERNSFPPDRCRAGRFLMKFKRTKVRTTRNLPLFGQPQLGLMIVRGLSSEK